MLLSFHSWREIHSTSTTNIYTIQPSAFNLNGIVFCFVPLKRLVSNSKKSLLFSETNDCRCSTTDCDTNIGYLYIIIFSPNLGQWIHKTHNSYQRIRAGDMWSHSCVTYEVFCNLLLWRDWSLCNVAWSLTWKSHQIFHVHRFKGPNVIRIASNYTRSKD